MLNTHVVTLSGAHGTGKTTLAHALQEKCVSLKMPVAIIPSISTRWMDEKSKELVAMGEPPLAGYDDINKRDFRIEMQVNLPRVLKESVVDTVLNMPSDKDQPSVIIVDRWFGDVEAYTVQEITDPVVLKVCYEENIKAHSDLIRQLDLAPCNICLHHYITNLSCCDFVVEEKANRATTSPQEWENIFHECYRPFYREANTHYITVSDLEQRVERVFTGCDFFV